MGTEPICEAGDLPGEADRPTGEVVSVECARICADRMLPLSSVDREGISIAAALVDRLTRAGSVCLPVVLLDDQRVDGASLSVADAVCAVSRAGLAPSAVIVGSALVGAAQVVLNAVTQRSLAGSLERWKAEHGRWPSSLMVAAWYLLRLGEIAPWPGHRLVPRVEARFAAAPVPPTADRLVNVLADEHRASEAGAVQILASTRWAGVPERIETIFHDQGLVAAALS